MQSKDQTAMITNLLSMLDMPLRFATLWDGMYFHLTAMAAYLFGGM